MSDTKKYPSILEQLYETTDNLQIFNEEYFYNLPCNEKYIENQKNKKVKEDFKKISLNNNE